ncbi:hypothetical protein ACFLVZ_03100 [Chloroflexota bacterium]
MNNCPKCNSNLLLRYKLIDDTVSPMKNKSKIIYPECSVCNRPVQVSDIEEDISVSRKVLLISGTAGAGKAALGQFIESKSDYIFIDGDAISKRVNYYARFDPSIAVPNYKMETIIYQKEMIRTMLVLLGLGYNVVAGYVINQEFLRWYREGLAKYQITPVFRVLVPKRNVCLQRDIDRECWTAGAEYVDRWYDEQRAYMKTDPEICIDSSKETLADTFDNHFQDLLSK